MSAELEFEKLGLNLPPAPAPKGVYKPLLIVGDFCYVSGHGPVLDTGELIIGRVGAELDAEQGKQAAQQTALTILSTIRSNLGSLDR
ncbi:hypothetical protein EDD80_107139, partial [Anseongella ginsenosidimutans]